jgi:hypothetical protein
MVGMDLAGLDFEGKSMTWSSSELSSSLSTPSCLNSSRYCRTPSDEQEISLDKTYLTSQRIVRVLLNDLCIHEPCKDFNMDRRIQLRLPGNKPVWPGLA